jgi:flagellar biosynthesis protein FlhF
MKQRLFIIRAHSLDEAQRVIEERHGAGAVVVNTHSVRAPGLTGFFGRRRYEVTIAVPDALSGRATQQRSATAVEKRYQSQDTLMERPAMDAQRVKYLEQLVRDAQARMGRAPESASPAQSPPAHSRDSAAPDLLQFPERRDEEAVDASRLRGELRQIREMIEVLYAENPGAGLPPEFSPHYRALTQCGVSRKVAAALLGTVARNGDLTILADPRVFRERLGLEIRRLALVTGGISLRPGHRHVVALCGATGVGKTTNIAKLAAHFSVRERARVALLTTDTYRIAAPEQLRVYANIIGVPLVVAENATQARDALSSFNDHDLVLVDTAGGSQFNLEQIKELKTMLHALRPDETVLVLGANTQLDDLRNVVSNFKCVGPTSLLFTKLDETRQYGSLFSLLMEAGLPLSYLSVGQVVPDDLRVATPKLVANLVMEDNTRHG